MQFGDAYYRCYAAEHFVTCHITVDIVIHPSFPFVLIVLCPHLKRLVLRTFLNSHDILSDQILNGLEVSTYAIRHTFVKSP
jgi:hypothetical protein